MVEKILTIKFPSVTTNGFSGAIKLLENLTEV